MGHDMMDDCMMCDMYHGCPSWCYNNWNYPYQALPAVNEKSATKTDSKGKWWYGNGYYGYQREGMMCSMYGCPSWCYNGGWNYPYQTLPAVGEKSETKTESKGKWWYGNGYGMMGHMYHGCHHGATTTGTTHTRPWPLSMTRPRPRLTLRESGGMEMDMATSETA